MGGERMSMDKSGVMRVMGNGPCIHSIITINCIIGRWLMVPTKWTLAPHT